MQHHAPGGWWREESRRKRSVKVPLGGGSSVPVTSCDQVRRKICAEDNCRVVEGEEECHDKVVASSIDIPEETCNMTPEEECKNVTTSVPQVTQQNQTRPYKVNPQLLPEQVCRQIPKEVCQTVFLNPRSVKVCVNDATTVVCIFDWARNLHTDRKPARTPHSTKYYRFVPGQIP